MKLLYSVVVLSLFGLVLSQNPVKPTWPDQFNSSFGLNIPEAGVTNATSYFYSNWQVKAQLIDYREACLDINIPARKQACKIWFLPTGGCYLSVPAQSICCLWFPGIGAIPPDFLATFNYSGTIQPALDQWGATHQTYLWEGSGFKYWTDVKTGDDIAFLDGDGKTYWNFGWLRDGNQSASIFDLPSPASACQGSCPSFVTHDREVLKKMLPHFQYQL